MIINVGRLVNLVVFLEKGYCDTNYIGG
uniref:Uncharacterized protein n=1 Tax=Triticum urartu TaxID=4572 RepID=A0A8R7U592_TRIUA